MLRLRAFGGLSIQGSEGPLEGAAAQRRRLALLALLAVAGERGTSRDRLLALLWPESEPEKARHVLAQALYALRRATGQEELVLGTTELRLNPQAMTSDIGEFETALAAGDLERACALHGGPFLEGFHLGDAPEFERWVDEQRARLTRAQARALETLAERAAAAGRHGEAADRWRVRAALDPVDSRVAIALMRALAAAGDRPGALQHARVYEALVRQELDAAPDPAVVALEKELREGPVVPVARPIGRRMSAMSAASPLAIPAGPASAMSTVIGPPGEDEAAPPDSLTGIAIGALVSGRYEVTGELGQGATARVYAARDRKHDRPVALKVLRPEIAETIGRQRFLREIGIAARLAHPHILPLFDSGDAAGCLYFVMPHADGRTLRSRLDADGPLPVREALRIAQELADALACAHAAGVVHRDVKPGNILLVGGHALLTDFGIARAITAAAGERMTDAGLLVGTPEYMSPEQVAGDRPIDGRSDVYSLGCVLQEMLTGAPPFAGPDTQSVLARKLAQPAPSVRTKREMVPPEVEGIVAAMLSREPADRPVAAELAEALGRLGGRRSGGMVPAVAKAFRGSSGWRRRAFGVAAVGALAGGIAIATGYVVDDELDADLIAVAPIEVFDPELTLWREGLMDLLSRNLDGAGPLRTVSPTVVVRQWKGRSDAESATQLGRNTGARLALFGQLLRISGDSVRMLSSVVDAGTGRTVVDVDVRDESARLDRLADTVTVRVLRQLAGARRIGAVPDVSIGSHPLPALKAFLQGEQLYRSNRIAEAAEWYARAVQEDDGFALAYRRMRNVSRGLRGERDSLSLSYAIRAGSLNRGLPFRDSLLIAADSLYAALYLTESGDPVWWSRLRRHFAALDLVRSRYPDDPEVWLETGESRFHFGERLGIGHDETLAAFSRALQLDSVFGPTYFHAIELALATRSREVARGYLDAYLALNPADSGFVLAARLLSEDRVDRIDAHIAQASSAALSRAAGLLRRWPDSAETASRIYRQLVRRTHEGQAAPEDASIIRAFLFLTLSYRGHAREAAALADGTTLDMLPAEFAQLAMDGAISESTAHALFADWTRDRDARKLVHALAWWSSRRDTAALRRGEDVLASIAGTGMSEQSALASYGVLAARAYRALASGDTALALESFEQAPDSVCPWYCSADRVVRARLLASLGRTREAANWLDARPPSPSVISRTEVHWSLERARLAERLGERDRARRLYAFVNAAWRNGDASSRALAEEALRGLARGR